MLTGLTLHDTGAYDANQREGVEQRYRFGRNIGIRHIVAKGTAAQAGFLPGDIITQVNDVNLADFETGLIGERASYDRTASFERYLNDVLAKGPAQVTLQRGQTTQRLQLTGQPGCGGKPVLYAKGGLNAWSDGQYVAVTGTMVRFARKDSELAFVLAHEMAHNILDHADRLRGRSMLLASFGIGSGKVKTTEIEADHLAAEIMVSAGLPIEGAMSLLQRAGQVIPFYMPITHPGIARRLKIVTLAAARYEPVARVHRAAGLPVLAMDITDLAQSARSVAGPGLLDLPILSATPTNELAYSPGTHSIGT